MLRHQKYRIFRNIRIVTEDSVLHLVYRVLVPKIDQFVDVEVKASVPIEVVMRPSDQTVPKSFIEELYEDIFLIVQLFEDEIRKTTLYLAFMPGERMVPELEKTGMHIRIFTDSMLTLYVALMAFRRLFPLHKREPRFRGYRRSEWLQFDPHPPAYFRIARLEGLQEPEKIRHTFLKSIRDSLTGFLRA